MVTDIIKSITEYVDYLKNILHLQVSFSNIVNCFEQYMHIFHPYNAHYNSYCTCIKSNDKTRDICIQKQFKVLQYSASGPFYGSCWAGVEEFVFPIKYEETTLGFISVSGYRGHFSDAEKKIRFISKKFGMDYQLLRKKHYALNENVPSINNLRVLISPLCLMFEMLYAQTPIKTTSTTKESSLYVNILNYLCFNYTKNITLNDVSEAMHYSKSYIRQIFQKKSQHSIGRYLTMLRIKRAKELLISTSLQINEIAYKIGYNASNYFKNIFKKETGMSPKKYRTAQSLLSENTILDKFCETAPIEAK